MPSQPQPVDPIPTQLYELELLISIIKSGGAK